MDDPDTIHLTVQEVRVPRYIVVVRETGKRVSEWFRTEEEAVDAIGRITSLTIDGEEYGEEEDDGIYQA